MDNSKIAKKSKVISLIMKNEIIAAALTCKSQNQLAKDFGLVRATIQAILQNKESIKRAIADGNEEKRTKIFFELFCLSSHIRPCSL